MISDPPNFSSGFITITEILWTSYLNQMIVSFIVYRVIGIQVIINLQEFFSPFYRIVCNLSKVVLLVDSIQMKQYKYCPQM